MQSNGMSSARFTRVSLSVVGRWSLGRWVVGRVRLPGKHQYQLRREPKECKGKAVRCLVEAAERASEVLQLV